MKIILKCRYKCFITQVPKIHPHTLTCLTPNFERFRTPQVAVRLHIPNISLRKKFGSKFLNYATVQQQ